MRQNFILWSVFFFLISVVVVGLDDAFLDFHYYCVLCIYFMCTVVHGKCVNVLKTRGWVISIPYITDFFFFQVRVVRRRFSVMGFLRECYLVLPI